MHSIGKLRSRRVYLTDGNDFHTARKCLALSGGHKDVYRLLSRECLRLIIVRAVMPQQFVQVAQGQYFESRHLRKDPPRSRLLVTYC